MPNGKQDMQRVILVTGPAGGGRTTAINALEDMGFEAIDNLPLSLVPRLLDGAALPRPLALGIDARGRQFSAEGLIELQMKLRQQPGVEPELLYLDCAPEVLLRRYSETRRRHPLAPTESPSDGIVREIALLQIVRERADILLDTSDLTPHDLRARVQAMFGDERPDSLSLTLVSFSYKRGLPPGADVVLDCRFLDNPYWQPELRKLTGLNSEVSDHIAQDQRFAPFIEKVTELATFLLPAVKDEGKAHFSIAFGCTGGQHRSVAVTEKVAHTLADQGWQVSIRHRELAHRGLIDTARSLESLTGERQS